MKIVLLSFSSFLYFCSINLLSSAETISWAQSVREASASNSELNAAKSTLSSSTYQINVSKSGYFPVISARAGYTYDSTNDPRSYSTSLNATENIFAGFSDNAKVERSRHLSSATEANVENVKAKISFDLKSAFVGLLYSQKYISLTEDIIKRRTANLKLVQLRFENGRENLGSLNLSKAYLAQAKYDRLQAMNSLEVYQADLARVLGREDYTELNVEGSVPVMEPPYENSRLVNYKDLLLETPDYKRAVFEELGAKSSLQLSKSSFYPTLNLNQSVGRSGREYNSHSDDWSVGATLVFPLFSGGENYYSYKSAAEDYRASALTTKSIKVAGLTKLKSAYTAYVEAVMKLEVDNAFVLAASSRERIAKAQYNNGLITFIDWDAIENDLINRQKSLLQSQRDRVVSEAAWEQVQGRGVIP